MILGREDDTMKESIFCDGACSGNGTARAVGGWSWAYWSGNVFGSPDTYASGKLTTQATNQRAELTALYNALCWARTNAKTVTIYSDSQYAIKCASVWGPGWKRKKWTRSTGGPLQNLDIIQPLVEIWITVAKMVTLQHVAGHQTGSNPLAYGNNWVDRAAVAGGQGVHVHAVDLPSVLTAKDDDEFALNLRAPTRDIRDWIK